jgi:hypothetical protein
VDRQRPKATSSEPERDTAGFRWEDMGPDESVFIRIRPYSVDGLKQHAETGRSERLDDGKEDVYCVSVWKATSPAEVPIRIDAMRGRFGVDPISIVPEADLGAFRVEETPADTPGHYDLILGRDLIDADLEALSAIFQLHKRRNK